jgi:hypothetical protein
MIYCSMNFVPAVGQNSAGVWLKIAGFPKEIGEI